MSLARFTTRMLAMAALLPQVGDADQITMAGQNVFDSRLDPLAFDNGVTNMPAITVYTDEDVATLQNRSANSGPFFRQCVLRIELVLGTYDTTIVDGTTYGGIAIPSTEAELEAKLDMFEMQVKWALMDWINRPATLAFRAWTMSLESIHSQPDRDESTNNKLASRRLLYQLRIRDDCPPVRVIGTPSMYTNGQNSHHGGGFTNQPPVLEFDTPIPGKQTFTAADFPGAPYLADMFVLMQDSPSFRPVIDQLAGSGNPHIFLPVLQRLGARIHSPMSGDPAYQEKIDRQDSEIQTQWELPL